MSTLAAVGRLQGLLRRQAPPEAGAAAPHAPRHRQARASRERSPPRATRALRLREQKLRDLGGLSLEMYRRDRFREDLLLERCAELIGLDARIHELDVLLGSANGARRGPHDAVRVWRTALWASRFCPSCGRPVAPETLEARVIGPGPPIPRCHASATGDQEYCLECGARLGRRPARIDRVRGTGGSAAWIVPAFVALVVAALGATAAIALSTSRAEPRRCRSRPVAASRSPSADRR